jgi:hypothetical protein
MANGDTSMGLDEMDGFGSWRRAAYKRQFEKWSSGSIINLNTQFRQSRAVQQNNELVIKRRHGSESAARAGGADRHIDPPG